MSIIARFNENIDAAIALSMPHCEDCGAPTTTPGQPKRSVWPGWAICGACDAFAKRVLKSDGNGDAPRRFAERLAEAAGKKYAAELLGRNP